MTVAGTSMTTAVSPTAARAPAPPTGGVKGGTGAGPSRRRRISPTAETWLAIGVVVIVALLVIPLPPVALDAMLAVSLALSLLILLVTLSTSDPIDFSIFPSLLLLITLLRLGLNVSSTRLILGQGAAGKVIDAFGDIVIGGNFIVGLVIFLILVVINFMVITKGAGRIAEVAARFTLDAMPGKQMAIDADLSAGLIDETEAKQRREEIARHADFYGAMDGSAKFVRGDAVAGLIITGINLVGGFIVGMTQQGLTAGESLTRYTSLTVGDGLVTQIPALIVSTAAGILVTYSPQSPNVGPAIANQLTRHPRAMFIAAGILTAFAMVPGLPSIPFLLLAGGAGGVAFGTQRKARRAETAAGSRLPTPAPAPAIESTSIQDLLKVEPLELEIGYALVPLVDEAQNGDLLKRISIMRKQVAMELGIVVPPARIRDNIQLPATEYAIKLRGMRMAAGEVMPRYLLALNASGTATPIDGIQTTDPTFGIPAVWIAPDKRVEAETNGYSVVEAQTVLSTHLMETIKRNASELLSRQNVRELLDVLKETHPALVEDTVPAKVSLGTLHRVLQRLLKEGIPVRDLVAILETVSDAAETTKDTEALTEHVRRSLATVISQLFEDTDGTVRGITLGPGLEAGLMGLFSPRPQLETDRVIQPEDVTRMLRSLGDLVERTRADGHDRPLLSPPSLRVGIRGLIEPVLPQVPVVSLAELPVQTPIQSLAVWELSDAA